MAEARRLVRLLAAKSTNEWVELASKLGFLHDDRVDLRACRLRLNHRDIDFRRFALDGADLSGSVLLNPVADGVSFRNCILRKVKIAAEPGKRGTLRGATFDGARIEDSEFGPRTLDMSHASFVDCQLVRVHFRLAELQDASFERAILSDVLLRGANLANVSFRAAKLQRTSLEKANLRGADFSEADFIEMAKWGEPDYEGAIISDGIRYRFGIVPDTVHRLESVLSSGEWSEDEKRSIEGLIARVRSFAADAPAAMLIEDEYSDIVRPDLFRRLLKIAKRVH